MENKKSWKRFSVALMVTSILVGGMVYNFVLVGLDLFDKSKALNEFYEIIISPLCLLIGAWIGADTVEKTGFLKNIINKKK